MPNPSSLTLIERRILRFFQEHPHAVETVRGISTWLGTEESDSRQALESLVSRRWLMAHEASSVTGYALCREERVLAQIRQALEEGKGLP